MRCTTCSAQVQSTSTTDVSVAQMLLEVPANNRRSDFEEGMTRHIAWLKANHEGWTWLTWEILTGKDTGKYVVASFGHKWDDFDTHETFNSAANSNFKESVGSALSSSSCTFYVLRTDLSLSVEFGTPS